jgi:PASTA domain
MARNVFSITATSSTVRLDASGHGEVPFTVSNLSAGGLRGRARVVAADPKLAKSFKISGDAERDFPANGTQQYTVQINTPAAANPGKYSFRLDVVSVELPDEEYAQGPNIGFEITAPVIPQKPRFPWWIIPILVVVILVAVGITLYITHPWSPHGGPSPIVTPSSIPTPPAKVTVPRVGGLTTDDAERAVRAAGLAPIVDPPQAMLGLAPGRVIKAIPDIGSLVTNGSSVHLVVAGDSTIVPPVGGLNGLQARAIISGDGLVPKLMGDGSQPLFVPTYSPVVGTNPPAGQVVLKGSAVTIVVRGPAIPWNVP